MLFFSFLYICILDDHFFARAVLLPCAFPSGVEDAVRDQMGGGGDKVRAPSELFEVGHVVVKEAYVGEGSLEHEAKGDVTFFRRALRVMAEKAVMREQRLQQFFFSPRMFFS